MSYEPQWDASVRPAASLDVAAHKGSAGRVLVCAGSAKMPGAALLVLRSAQRAGAGLVELACMAPELSCVGVTSAPEAVYLDREEALERMSSSGADALVCGPGLGELRNEPWLSELVEGGWKMPAILDADALNRFAGSPEALARFEGELVLTPHPGEARRLLGRDFGASAKEREEAARELALRSAAIVCLKGAGTVVTDGDRMVVNPSGNPGMATAGSGDVLAGILGAYLTQVGKPHPTPWTAFDAALAAVHVHGLSGDCARQELGERGMVASDLIEWLPRAQRLGEEWSGAR